MVPSDDDIHQLVDDSIRRAAEAEAAEERCRQYEDFFAARGVDLEIEDTFAVLRLAFTKNLAESGFAITRKHVEALLWKDGRYEEPWLELVAAEFEGEGLTDEEIDELALVVLDELPGRIERARQFQAKTHEYAEFLLDHGLEGLEDDDIHLLLTFANRRLIGDYAGLSPDSYHAEAVLRLLEHGRGESDAWRLLVDREFTSLHSN